MAESERNTGELVYHEKINYDRWIGTADQLITAGLVELHQLPGQPGNRKVCMSFGNRKGGGERNATFHKDADFLHIQKYGRSKFIVTRGIANDEMERRQDEYFRLQEEAEAERQKQHQLLKQLKIKREKREYCAERVSYLPKDGMDFRDKVWDQVGHLRFFFDGGLQHGYRYSDTALRRIDLLLAELREIVNDEGVIFDAEERDYAIRLIYEKQGIEPPTPPTRSTPRLRLVK